MKPCCEALWRSLVTPNESRCSRMDLLAIDSHRGNAPIENHAYNWYARDTKIWLRRLKVLKKLLGLCYLKTWDENRDIERQDG